MPDTERKIEWHYQAQAKRLVDFLFDAGYFASDLSRDGMNDVENLIAYYLQSGAESAAKCAIMTKKLKEIPKSTKDTEG